MAEALNLLINYFRSEFFPAVFLNIKEIVFAPSKNPEMIWMVVPLIISILFMTLNFGKYVKEKVGWNTAFGNSLILIYTSMDLLRYIYEGKGASTLFTVYNFLIDPIKTSVAIVIGGIGIILLLSNFEHLFPEKFAFFISSSPVINLIAYICISAVYTNMHFGYMTVIAAAFVLVVLVAIVRLLQFLELQFVDKEKAKGRE